jgi:ssDNA-binding Zn-finger/Zn-ribbon topoisomerase 1
MNGHSPGDYPSDALRGFRTVSPQDQSMSPAKQKGAECKKKGHDWVLQKREKGLFWGYNAYYKCQRCGMLKTKWE